MGFIFLCCLLSSCGKSGALYLPSDKADTGGEKISEEPIKQP